VHGNDDIIDVAMTAGRLPQFHTRLVAERQLGVRMRHKLVRTAVLLAQGQLLTVYVFIAIDHSLCRHHHSAAAVERRLFVRSDRH